MDVITNEDKLSTIGKGDRIVELNNIDLTGLQNKNSATEILLAIRDSKEDLVQLVISRPIELIEVTLSRASKGFGFKIDGGIETYRGFPGVDVGIFVTKVVKGGPADIDGRILPGDKLMAIKSNPFLEKDFYLNNCTLDEASNALKQCKDKVVLLVAKTHFIEYDDGEDDSCSDFEHVESEDSIEVCEEMSEIESDQEPYLNTNRCESNLSEDKSNNEVADDKDEDPGLPNEGSSIQKQEPKRSKTYVFLDSLHTTFKGIFKLFICFLLIQYFCTKFAHHNPEDVAMIQDLESRLDSLTIEYNGKLNEMEKYADKFKKQSISDEGKIKDLEQRLESTRLDYDRKIAEMDKHAYKLQSKLDLCEILNHLNIVELEPLKKENLALKEANDHLEHLVDEKDREITTCSNRYSHYESKMISLQDDILALQESNELLVKQTEEEIDAITDMHNNCVAKFKDLENEYVKMSTELFRERFFFKPERDRQIERLNEELLAYQEKEQHYMSFIENLQDSVSNAHAQLIN